MISQPFDLFFWFFNQIDLFFWFLNQILICSWPIVVLILCFFASDLYIIFMVLDLSWSRREKNHDIPYSHEILYCASLLDLYIIFLVLDLVLQTTAPLLLILIFSWSLKTLCSFTTAPLPLILIFSWSLILCSFTTLHCLWS